MIAETPRRGPLQRILTLLLWIPLLLAVVWCVGAILLGGGGPGGPGVGRWALALALALLALLAAIKLSRGRAQLVVAILCLTVVGAFLAVRPSNDRVWSPDHSRLPRVEVDGPLVTIHDIRDFRYRSPDDWDEGWYDATFDTRELEGVDFIVVHFSDNKSIGHTMVSFRFADERTLTFSVEVRKEVGERYGVLRGLFRQFEIMYVIGAERDLVGLRTHHRKNEVYLHPVRHNPEAQREYLLDMCRRANELREEPAFYNTLLSNCTTNLVAHWEHIHGERLPPDRRWILAGRADEFAFELGLLDTDVGFQETRDRNRIGPGALDCAEDAGFSACIRGTGAGR